MLKLLKIQNFAIIQQSEVNFSNGLNVISGETGSGKSIVLKALKFVLGSRGDKSVIRDKCDFVKVQATFFDFENEELNNVLSDFGIDCDEQLIISRSMHLDGKNDIRVNGSSVTLNMLNKISSYMVDIYNQEEHFSLLDVKKHLQIVDAFKYNEVYAYKNKIALILDEIKEIDEKLQQNCASEEDKAREIDLLSYQIQEIEGNIFTQEELNDLLNKKNIFANLKKISEHLQNCTSIMEQGYSGFPLASAIKEVQVHLSNLNNIDSSYNDLISRLDNIKFEIQDISEQLLSNLEILDVSDSEIDKVEERLDSIKTLKKKYGPELEDIEKNLKEFKNKLDYIENNDKIVNELNKKKAELISNGLKESEKLSKLRHEIANSFEMNIIAELNDLGMKGAKFKVMFKEYEKVNSLPFNKDGIDNVEFIFSANQGQEMKPLSKIISGGELSRFMLSYKNVAHKIDAKDLLVFDEIDAGISGAMGQKLAIKLNNIGKDCQIISINHLPQIICMANSNYLVEKITKDNQTISIIKNINKEELINEVARLCGNGEVSQTNLKLATELLEQANCIKN